MYVESAHNTPPSLFFQEIVDSLDGIRKAASWTKRWLFTYNKVP